jgi:hypothetical protein
MIRELATVNHQYKVLASRLDYATYSNALAWLARGQTPEMAGMFDRIKDLALTSELQKLLKELKGVAQSISEEFGLGIQEVINAFRQRDVFKLLKAVKFNLYTLFKAVHAFLKFETKALVAIFKEISNSKLGEALKRGATSIDEVLDKYPLLKKLSGPVIAGLLIYVWLNMTFIGDPSFDFDLSLILLALAGHFSIHDLFATPEGLLALALLGTGLASAGLISVSWLGSNIANFVVALVYTALTKFGAPRDLLRKIKSKIRIGRL